MSRFYQFGHEPTAGGIRPAVGRVWSPINEHAGFPDNWRLYMEGSGWAEIVLNEGSTCSSRLKFRGKFQEHSALNKNRRLYTERALRSNVDRLMELVEGRKLYGELDHPTDSVIHLRNASHLVTKLWWEGNVLMGEGEILDTPSGVVLAKCMAAGGGIGISSRGVGNGDTRGDGVLVIDEQYKLITFDAVADPSTFKAFQQQYTGRQQEAQAYEFDSASDLSIDMGRERSRNEGRRIDNVNHNALLGFIGSELDEVVQRVRRRFRR